MLGSNCRLHLKLLYTTVLISYIMFFNGCSFALSSTLLPELRSPSSPIQIDDEDASWIASILYLLCPIGLIGTGVLSDNIGRRKALQIAFIPICCSWIVLMYANSAFVIIIARLLMGVSTGIMPFVVLYLVEVCPREHRSLYMSLINLSVSIGMVTENVMSLFFGYHAIATILAVMSVAGCVSLFLLPETPMWLRSKNRAGEAEAADKWFGIEPPATVTAVDAENGCASSHGDKTSGWSVYTRPTVWKPTLIMLAFFVCLMGSGIYVLLMYSTDVLRGSPLSLDPKITVYMSTARLVGGVVFSLLFEVKRRTLMVYSSMGMAVSVAVFIGYMKWYAGSDDPPCADVVIVAFVCYVFFSLLGVIPLAWMISGELFPMEVKGKMCAVVNIFGYLVVFITCKIYPAMSSTFGVLNIWSIFGGFCIITALFGQFVMPETKGKSLDDIIKSFESKKSST
ncbi:facilitated trehalose transporter Tret1-like [Sipha flava]|uniref:Facilitated trehalose transporter Tret1 n=1 Tax=Sipha flava TaxID=143950 RepID=A0A2S2Q646_9HEMI|nr:facilitated trehalose transporter Tret1-like [Sipha flava]